MAAVTTTRGALAGAEEGGLNVFRGIPFAQPPVGELRWRAPQPVEPWSGVRDATEFGFAAWQGRVQAPQGDSPYVGMFGTQTLDMSEDCLTLNVWTPGLDGSRPVMVWIHGGSFRTGTGSSLMYDGVQLAARGDIVVVTINYRLGALGYLYCDGLDANVGSRDQVAALEWVRDEIASFGGDPSQVTIFGESAGGKSVETLLAMPAARGLYQRAIMQSTYDPDMTPDVVAETAAELLGELGVSPDPEGLRGLDAEAVIAAQTALQMQAMAGTRPQRGTNPVVDGTSVARQPLDAVADGEVADVPILIGSNLDEAKLFGVFAPGGLPEVDEAVLLERVMQGGGSLAQAIDEDEARALIDGYRAAREARGADVSPQELLMAINSDRTFRIHSTRLAAAQARHQSATYMYLFSWQAEMFEVGACHALEIPFVFGTFDAPLGKIAGGEEGRGLSDQMKDAWIAFAKSGDPSHEGLPAWPAYDGTERATMVFDRESQVALAPLEVERALWDA